MFPIFSAIIIHTSIELFPFSYCLKDLSTGAPLFCWQNKDGLYEWSSGSEHHTPQCNVSIPPNPWNRWLGHPNHHTLNMILHQFSLVVYYSRTTSICNFFYSNKMHMLPFFWKIITLSMTFVNNLYWFMGIISCFVNW